MNIPSPIMQRYAVLEVGGRQLQVESGRFYDMKPLFNTNTSLDIERIGEKLLFTKILMIADSSQIVLGQPWVKNAKVLGRILSTPSTSTTVFYHMKAKKKTRKKRTYSQKFVRFVVEDICLQ